MSTNRPDYAALARKHKGVVHQDLSQFMVEQNPKGLKEPGNLPIWKRPTVQNSDGTHSSEYSTSFQDPKTGYEVLVPTIVNGKFLTPDGKKPKEGSPEEKAMFKAAWQHYLQTGENLGKFDNPEDADTYAGVLHNRGQKNSKQAEPPKKQLLSGKQQVTQVENKGYGEIFPPELSRIVGSLDPRFVTGKPMGDAIANVRDGDARTIEINDQQRFAQDPVQTTGHELTHLWASQLPGPLQKQVPADSSVGTYDISNLDVLRKHGVTFLHLPREKQATIIQTWIAKPSERKRLQPWLDDMGKTPLSIMMPTDSSSKELNRKVRPPLPPLESFKK